MYTSGTLGKFYLWGLYLVLEITVNYTFYRSYIFFNYFLPICIGDIV